MEAPGRPAELVLLHVGHHCGCPRLRVDILVRRVALFPRLRSNFADEDRVLFGNRRHTSVPVFLPGINVGSVDDSVSIFVGERVPIQNPAQIVAPIEAARNNDVFCPG